jgi:DNA-binding Xre family transcriptional regulator
MEKRIRMAIIHAGITHADLAQRLQMSAPAFSQKLKRDTWTFSEFCDLCAALGCKYECRILFPDGVFF